MSNEQQQRPEPRFRMGQVVFSIGAHEAPLRIVSVWLNNQIDEWSYTFSTGGYWRESGLRPLSAEEIGGDEVARLSEMLLGADSRRADMETQRNAAREIARKLLDVAQDADATLCNCRHDTHSRQTGCNCDIHAAHRILRAVIAEAESVLGKEGA